MNKLDKVRKEYPEFVEETAGLSVEELNLRLASIAKSVAETEDAKEEDRELVTARETAKFLAAPYSDTKKALALKARFIVELIKDKGGA